MCMNTENQLRNLGNEYYLHGNRTDSSLAMVQLKERCERYAQNPRVRVRLTDQNASALCVRTT